MKRGNISEQNLMLLVSVIVAIMVLKILLDIMERFR